MFYSKIIRLKSKVISWPLPLKPFENSSDYGMIDAKRRFFMDKFIIAISREFGSGGRLIGEKLATRLGVEFYDKNIIQLAAERSGLSAKFIEQNEENVSSGFLFALPAATSFSSFRTAAYYDTPVNDKTFLAQAEVIRELAKNSCVIVGRCADYILREDPALIKVFITSPFEARVRRAVEEYQFPTENPEEKIRKIDKSRANYYKYYTTQAWGSVHNYDLVVNSAFTGILGAVSVIMTMLEEKGIEGKAF
jgi:cytidylate kinase